MSSNASVKTPGKQPSRTRGARSRVCVICRRSIAQDDVPIDIHDVSAHVRPCGLPAPPRTPLMQRILVRQRELDDRGSRRMERRRVEGLVH